MARDLIWKTFGDESQLSQIIELVSRDLSEPYSMYTYRYFVYTWPWLCHLVYDLDTLVGVVVGKVSYRADGRLRGYIAMLAVLGEYRGQGVGRTLVQRVMGSMIDAQADEIVLEAEESNLPALRLYQSLGFIRDKKLTKYYQGENDAYRLKYQV